MFAACLLSMVVLSGCKENAWTPMGNAELVLSQIKLGGAAAVARRIDDDEAFGQTVMSGVATGDSAWLEVARNVQLRSAAAEASMAIALAAALPHSPRPVVALLGRKYPVAEVCSIPLHTADSQSVNSYRDSAALALARVKDTAFVAERDACVAELDQARERKLRRIDPSYLIKNKPKPLVTRRRRKPSK
jgi:hypothetical protein